MFLTNFCHPHQTWNKDEMLHHPENFLYTTNIFEIWNCVPENYGTTKKKVGQLLKIQIWVPEEKHYCTTKKVVRLLKIKIWVPEEKNYCMTKKKVVRAFTPTKKTFTPPKNVCYNFSHKILHHFQKIYTILDGKDGNLFYLWFSAVPGIFDTPCMQLQCIFW